MARRRMVPFWVDGRLFGTSLLSDAGSQGIIRAAGRGSAGGQADHPARHAPCAFYRAPAARRSRGPGPAAADAGGDGMERAMTRRAVVAGGGRLAGAGALALALAERGRGGALAQDGTPTTGAGLNFPELTMTITDQATQVTPDTIPAGFVLVTVVNNQSAQAGSTGAGLVGPPAG